MMMANSAIGVLNRLGMAKTDLSEDALLTLACESTGLSNYGESWFRPNLRHMLHSLEHEARLTPMGRAEARMLCLSALRNRLRAHELWARHPQIMNHPLRDPVAIIGLGRSGTTRLQRLMACDDRLRTLKQWEAFLPVPWPESFTSSQDPRIQLAERGLRTALWMNPRLKIVHPVGAFEAEEELSLLEHSFASQLGAITRNQFSHAAFLERQDLTSAYRYLVSLIRTIDWFNTAEQGRPWVLKTPQHMYTLGFLLKVFPGCRLIFIHRDPVRVIGSMCSLDWTVRNGQTSQLAPFDVGRKWLNEVERMIRKVLAARENIPPGQQLDVQYAHMNADWLGVMRSIYAFIGLELTDAVIARMTAWLELNQPHNRGRHSYSLAEFGIATEEVQARYQFYRELFDVPCEGSDG